MGKRDIYAYSGKILRVDLTGPVFSCEPTAKYARDWLGGSGIGQWILYNEVKPWVTPYEPANRLSFGAGPLVGTLAPGACRISADSINGLTMGVGSSNSDSHFGHELKFAGYDQIIISGKARTPVYLWIDNDRMELRDASQLWGKTTWETVDAIRHELGDDDIHMVSIGPAGENLCRVACIIQDKGRALGRCGLGGIMGSKNLKAIAARGSGTVEVAQPGRFMRAVDKLRQEFEQSEIVKAETQMETLLALFIRQNVSGITYKNNQDTTFPDDVFKHLAPNAIQNNYRVRNVGYMSCPIACSRYYRINHGPYAGFSAESYQFEAMHDFVGKLGVTDLDFLLKINAYCNQMGLDVDGASIPIAWAMECYQRGILKEDDTDGLKLNWGDAEIVLELIRKIASREGFGNVLAEGCDRASQILGRDSSYYAMHMKGQDLYEPLRGDIGWALGVCTSTRGGGHTTGTPFPGLIPDSDEEYRQRSPDFTDAGNSIVYEGKAEKVWYFERLHRINNSFGICHFCSPGIIALAELYSAATGWETTEDDLKRAAARILNVEKAFNLLRTDLDRKDDYPTLRDLEEPIPSGPHKGWQYDKDKWGSLLDEYYQMNKWDKKNGFPTRKCLEDLDLKPVADDLENIGKLGTGE